MPVHRVPGGPKAGVFAHRAELDTWLASKRDDNGSDPPDMPKPEPPQPPKRRKSLRRAIWAAGLLTVAAAGWFGVAAARNPRLLFTAPSRFTPFATSLALQTCPVWSPDGRSIAFSTRIEGRMSLMVQALDSTRPVDVTGPSVSVMAGGNPTWCRKPIWSPDSQWLYFLGTANQTSGVHRVAAGGGEPTLIQAGAAAAGLSPDGETLVFLAKSATTNRYQVWHATPPGGQRIAYEPAPYEAESFSNIPEIAFRPDGKAFLSGITIGNVNQFWLAPWSPAAAERKFQKVEKTVGTPSIAWMPDSRHLLFTGNGLLGAADIRNERYWLVAAPERRMHSPTPSPDGARMAYELSLSHADVVAVPLQDGPVETLLGSSAYEWMPVASAADPQLAYVSDKRGHGEVWIRNIADGTDRRIVRPGEVRIEGEAVQTIMTPAFSQDGTRIAFVGLAPSGGAIFTTPAAGGVPARASASKKPKEFSPTWSPDGSWLAFRSNTAAGPRVAKMRLGSGDDPVDLGPMCGQSMPEWSPTGEWIAYLDEKCRTSLVRPDGGERRTFEASGTMAWSRDGRTVYVVSGATHQLSAVDIATGAVRVLRDVGDLIPYSGPQPGLRASLTFEGKRVVYSVLRPREEIWILEDLRIEEPWYARLLPLLGK
jgi:Tol biopolymer transport system component